MNVSLIQTPGPSMMSSTPVAQGPVPVSTSGGPVKPKLPDGGRLFEAGVFKKIKIEARRRFRAIYKAELPQNRKVTSSLAPDIIVDDAIIRPPPGITIPNSPPGWQDCIDEMIPTASQFGSFHLASNTLEFTRIVELIRPYKVVSVNKIVNRVAWDKYVTYRTDLLKKKSNDPEVWMALGMDKAEIESRQQLDEDFKRDPLLNKLKYDLNEALLFHCTDSEENVRKILQQGMDDRRQMDPRKMYMGKGLYFADTPAKYMEEISSSNTIMLFTVILGDCKYYDDKGVEAKELKREPEKKSMEKRNEGDGTWESITARPDTGFFNEYVIYDRRQCCPLYEIIIKPKSIYRTKGKHGSIQYTGARDHPPNIAWFDLQNSSYHLPLAIRRFEWPFLCSLLFKKMDLAHNLELLKEMGLGDENDIERNTFALLHYENFEEAVNFLTGNCSRKEDTSDGDTTSYDEDDEDDDEEPILKKTKMSARVSTATPSTLTCPICCFEYEDSSRPCVPLKCSHELCETCYDSWEVSGTTVGGENVSGIKCPFCNAIDGIYVGNCPDGKMTESLILTSCSGYEEYCTWETRYEIDTNGYYLDRTCYLPDNLKGKQVRRLLKIGWDRRLLFVIGTSATTGATNTLIWNIHQKTSLTGGVFAHGYPDEGYLDRVLKELRDNGIG